MPYLALVHLRELNCSECSVRLAEPGARSFIVDPLGEPVLFPDEGAPEEMEVQILCPDGHDTTLFVPNEIGAEEILLTPEEAPLGLDAIFVP